MNISLSAVKDKATLFKTVRKELAQHNYKRSREDENRKLENVNSLLSHFLCKSL